MARQGKTGAAPKLSVQDAIDAAARDYPGRRLERVLDRPGCVTRANDSFDDAVLDLIVSTWSDEALTPRRNAEEIIKKMDLARHALDMAMKGMWRLRDRAAKMENGEDDDECCHYQE